MTTYLLQVVLDFQLQTARNVFAADHRMKPGSHTGTWLNDCKKEGWPFDQLYVQSVICTSQCVLLTIYAIYSLFKTSPGNNFEMVQGLNFISLCKNQTTLTTQFNKRNWFSYPDVKRIIARTDLVILAELEALALYTHIIWLYMWCTPTKQGTSHKGLFWDMDNWSCNLGVKNNSSVNFEIFVCLFGFF